MRVSAYTLLLAGLWCLPSAPAQERPPFSGHWQGSIVNHHQEIRLEVDLAPNRKGQWIGTIDIPAQKVKGLRLSDVVVKDNDVTFGMKGPPGDPKFAGKLYKSGDAIYGSYTQGEVTVTFSLRRTGDAVLPPETTGITKEMEGWWEGALESNGKVLRLRLKLYNQPDGTANGTLVSTDQEGGEFPITTLTQEGANLKFEAKNIQGSYDGYLSDGALAGYWTLGSAKLPLTFRRPQAAKREDAK